MGNESVAAGFDPDEVRERYRLERERRLRPDGPDQYREMTGDFARFAEADPYADPGFARDPITDDIDIAIIGGGFSGLLDRGAADRPGRSLVPHHRGGRRLRRHLVLEPLPGRPVRHRVVLLPAAARRARLHAEGEVLLRLGDLRALPAHRAALRPVRAGDPADPGPLGRLGRDAGTLADQHQPRRRHPGAVRGDGARHAPPGRSCPASPASNRSKGTRSTPPLGLRLHGRGHHRRHDEPGRQEGGDHRHRRDSHPMRAARRPIAGHLYVFQRTPSTVDWRRNRPTDSEWFAGPGAGLAARAPGELHGPGRIRIVNISPDIFELGMESHRIGGATVRVYSAGTIHRGLLSLQEPCWSGRCARGALRWLACEAVHHGPTHADRQATSRAARHAAVS